jgi:hypothetical protein
MSDRVTDWRAYRAYLTRPHDGDSMWVMTDGGFDSRSEPELRLYDVHAPELVMLLPPMFQPGGTDTTNFVNDWFSHAQSSQPGVRWFLSVAVAMTARYEPTEQVTFRRYVARVFRYADWPRPWSTPMPDEALSLNALIRLYLAGHPEWPTGE